jgi:sortase A
LRRRFLRVLEITTLVAGIGLLAFFVAAHVEGYLASRAAIEQFEAASSQPAPAPARQPEPVKETVSRSLPAPAKVDFSLWSPGRIRAYRQSLVQEFAPPIALLKIPKIHLVVPVFDGTDDLTLNRGAGRIAGTAQPGAPGNLGIAAHRDGFFRGLKDVSRGDRMELVERGQTATYVIDRIEIVTPKDVSVLKPGPVSELTLVTCYPFYYVGSAPKRYVVVGSLEKVVPNAGQRSGRTRQDASQGEARQ